MLTNFRPEVPNETREEMYKLAELCRDYIDDLPGDSFGDKPEIEEVEYQSRDGFISYNLGGFTVSQRYYCGLSSGIFHTISEREFYEKLQNDCAEYYKRDNPECGDDFYQTDEYSEYEQSYFDDCYTIIEAELFVTDDLKVQCSLLAHYKDAPYHRTKYAEEISVKSYSLSEFNAVSAFSKIKADYEVA